MKKLLCFGGTALVVVTGAHAADDDSPVRPSDLKAFASRFEKVRAEYAKWHEEFEKDLGEAEHAREVNKVRIAARPLQTGYLRFVMMLEEDLRLLANPEDEMDEEAEPEGFSLQERRRVASLRQEIRVAERERIRAELTEGRGPHSDEEAEEDISDDERSLDSIFDRNAAKLQRDIAKAEQELAEVRKSGRRDEREIDEQEKELEEWKGALSRMHEYVYGLAPAAGFDFPVSADLPAEVAKLLETLAQEREAVMKSMRGEEGEGGEGEKKGGVVGGAFIYSANLGVVLDVSGSMAPHIEELKKEIAKTFTVPRYREINGCRIHGDRFGALTLKGLSSATPDTLSVIEELTAVWGVDTVYWFCDLRDGFDFRGLRRLRSLLMRSGAAFHVKSMGLRPERELKPLIDDFQG